MIATDSDYLRECLHSLRDDIQVLQSVFMYIMVGQDPPLELLMKTRREAS
jgi:hypothetical protein